jgi:uncharacterized membrane protein
LALPIPACFFTGFPYNSTHMNQLTRKIVAWRLPWNYLVLPAAVLVLIGWLLNTPPGILGKADAVAYAVCHRIAAHSLYMGTTQLPLCARCTGMYLGAVLGLVYQWIIGKKRSGFPHWSVIIFLAAFLTAFGIDGINSYLHFFPGAPSLYEPQNWLRLVTGMGMGLGIAAVIFPAFNQTVWSEWDARPALGSLPVFGLLMVLALILVGLVLTGNPLILYPLALISAAGVLVLLSMVYTMVWLMALRLENRFVRASQLFLPLTGGFTFGLLQIAAFDFVRFLFTHTWDGFHLG